MKSMTESAGVINFDQALLTATARATAAYPAEAQRISRALAICLRHGVTVLEDGTALVASQSQDGASYTVNGACPCKATVERCAHRWAKSLHKWAISHMAAQVAPSETYYASYYGPDKEAIHGTATWTDTGWLFSASDGSMYAYVAIQALALGGRCDLSDGQAEADGPLWQKVCQHDGCVTK